MARSTTGQILPEGSRVYVEEQLFRADVEERLFRAVSASAFDCGLQPRPALKAFHPPAVAAMTALPRSCKLLCSGREEASRLKKPRCGTGSWYPPLCLQHLEKQGNGAASVCSGSGNGGPARHHVTRKCRIILFTLVIPRAFTPEESAFAPNRVHAADATPPDTPRVSAAPCRPA